MALLWLKVGLVWASVCGGKRAVVYATMALSFLALDLSLSELSFFIYTDTPSKICENVPAREHPLITT